jgi:hypothetical protein
MRSLTHGLKGEILKGSNFEWSGKGGAYIEIIVKVDD